jgi:hypothetical protein
MSKKFCQGLLRVYFSVPRLSDAPNSVNAAIQRVIKAKISINWTLIVRCLHGDDMAAVTQQLEPVDMYAKDLIEKGRLGLPHGHVSDQYCIKWVLVSRAHYRNQLSRTQTWLMDLRTHE